MMLNSVITFLKSYRISIGHYSLELSIPLVNNLLQPVEDFSLSLFKILKKPFFPGNSGIEAGNFLVYACFEGGDYSIRFCKCFGLYFHLGNSGIFAPEKRRDLFGASRESIIQKLFILNYHFPVILKSDANIRKARQCCGIGIIRREQPGLP